MTTAIIGSGGDRIGRYLPSRLSPAPPHCAHGHAFPPPAARPGEHDDHHGGAGSRHLGAVAEPRAGGHAGGVHKTAGIRDPAASFPLRAAADDTGERRQANRPIAICLAPGAGGTIDALAVRARRSGQAVDQVACSAGSGQRGAKPLSRCSRS